jgi:uncharacterized membrane protein YhaH (DUF805 family)
LIEGAVDNSQASESTPRSFRFCDVQHPLDRQTYALIGVSLMLLKYVVEWAAIKAFTGLNYTPIDFFNPLLSARQMFLQGAPDWFGIAWVLWTLPFVAIAVTLSVRRATDAGMSPWWGMAILVPMLNFLTMIVLAIAPGRAAAPVEDTPLDQALAADGPSADAPPQWMAAAIGILVGVAYAMSAMLLFIYGFKSYGSALFFGLPVVCGAASAFHYNSRQPRSWFSTLGVSLLPALLVGGLLLVFALEGAICIAMAMPIMLPLSLAGGFLGKNIAAMRGAHGSRPRQLAGCLVALPILAFGESRLSQHAEFCVETSVHVAVAPAVVWRNVISFPSLDQPAPWLFRLGIAGPQGARIEGHGVGALRHCDFTTGSFVEPITAWDEPRRLAFDVTDQPEPMFELSPYRDIHPPHLNGAFRSTHGEFVLEPSPDGGTRLIGRTWYTLELAPAAYWTIWTDWVVHRIHLRVLEHIKRLAEHATI